MVKLNRQYFRSNQGSRSSDSKRDEKITCLRCGQTGHRAANCPAPQPKESKLKEMAPFVCYVDSAPFQEHGTLAFHQDIPESDAQLAPELALQTGEGNTDLPTTAEAVESGKAIVDCGATTSLGSVFALERVMQLSSNGVSQVDVGERPVFGFGNSSEERCVSTLHLNLMAGGRPGQIKVHALDKGSAPILFSVASLKAFGAIRDFAEGAMVMRKVDDRKLVQLEQSRAGHLLIPLTGDILKNAISTPVPAPALSNFVQTSAAPKVPQTLPDESLPPTIG